MPRETTAVFEPFSWSKFSNPVLLFEGHPDFGTVVSDGEFVEELLVAYNLQLLAESVEFGQNRKEVVLWLRFGGHTLLVVAEDCLVL